MSESIQPKRQYRRKSAEQAAAEAAPVEPASAASEPASTPRAPRLTPSEIFQLRLAEAEVRTAMAEKEAARLRRLYYLALIDPKGTVLAEEKRLGQKEIALREAQALFTALRARIGDRLKVDLNKCGLDVETGEVVVASA